jgi:hypothetical protein
MSVEETIDASYTAIANHQWWLLASTLVVALVMFLREAAKRVGWLEWATTNRGGVIFTALITILGGFAHATAAGHSPDAMFWLLCLKVFLGAVGQYVSVKKLIQDGKGGQS